MKKFLTILFLCLAFIPVKAQEDEPIDSALLLSIIKETVEKQIIKEICNVPFGTSIENAHRILTNKYGKPDSETHNAIIYLRQYYAGFFFDSIVFSFQSDGTNTYFNDCKMIIGKKTRKAANEAMESLYTILSEKYISEEKVNKDGEKYYSGALSPTGDNVGYRIIIMDSSKSELTGNQPYQTILWYGAYDYIKEEF